MWKEHSLGDDELVLDMSGRECLRKFGKFEKLGSGLQRSEWAEQWVKDKTLKHTSS